MLIAGRKSNPSYLSVDTIGLYLVQALRLHTNRIRVQLESSLYLSIFDPIGKVPVMGMERRASVIRSDHFETTNVNGRMTEEMTKSMSVSKRMVYNSYLKVSANRGSAGIDKESIEMFDADLSSNLYKLWNRMASGSYFPPPVRTVFIPKKGNGIRALGIPTVSDRIAQGVVKDYLEPLMEPIFHRHSYGYRPGRSAHNALNRCQDNCTKHAWVIDVNIKGFFDNINHQKMMKLLEKHTQER